MWSLLIWHHLYFQLSYPNRQIQRYFSALTAAARQPFRFNYSKQTNKRRELCLFLIAKFLNRAGMLFGCFLPHLLRKHVSNKQLILLLQVGLLGHTASQKTKLKMKIVGKKKTNCSIIIGYVGNVVVSSLEWEIGEPISNLSEICYIHLCTNILVKSLNPSVFPLHQLWIK